MILSNKSSYKVLEYSIPTDTVSSTSTKGSVPASVGLPTVGNVANMTVSTYGAAATTGYVDVTLTVTSGSVQTTTMPTDGTAPVQTVTATPAGAQTLRLTSPANGSMVENLIPYGVGSTLQVSYDFEGWAQAGTSGITVCVWVIDN